ncbi:putative RING finger protein P8B7.23 [Choanephora cucurbitarum]|uniref:Putative RING finger protein P8B7.23 n=1 Tax=Choanephora cucurbitarum TaxID=101091 RepID=A0A1C7N3R9_9FUNG|nr:putative RING finger protein P8B7.23 [Choanephora cucurbitarum]
MNANAPTFVPTSSPSNDDRASQQQQKNKLNHNKKRQHRKRTPRNNNQQPNDVADEFQDMSLVDVAQRTGGSIDKKGRVSLNHLLSFSFPERQEAPSPQRKAKVVTSYQPFNKERFINANFRFMLNPTGNYDFQLADPDINFDWDTIEQVLISSTEAQVCPICLSPPTAARVTKCGHIYCYPCILHYLELRENPKRLWRKCPICWDSIYEADLKSVRIMKPFAISGTHSESNKPTLGVAEGDLVDMSLIQRSHDSTLAFPLSDTWPLPPNVISNYMKPDTPLIPWHFTPQAMHFARFMLASPDYLMEEYNRDVAELDDAVSDAHGWGSSEELPFIERCRGLIRAKIKSLCQQNTKELELAMHTSNMMFEAVAKYSKKHGKSSSQIQLRQEQDAPEAYHQQASASSNSHVSGHLSTSDFYFYQASDGQHVYLHPLDIRILKHEFGEYSQFPTTLQVQATNVQESTLTEDLRKKCKYLGHLPLACDVTFLEINVKDIVSPETIQVFDQELTARTKRRKDKERREDQKRRQAESKHKLQAAKDQELERQMFENDPFFSMYRPAYTAQESEEQLSQALSESAAVSSLEEDSFAPSSYTEEGPRTVWGTRQVVSREEELMMNEPLDWADHIVITKSHRKKKGKRH